MPPAGATNTGRKNSQGRTIFRGPRGGEYVLGAGGRVIRSFTRASTPAAPAPVAATPALPGNTGNKNTKGRTIYRGPRGGEYVLNGTRKIRTFTRATTTAAGAAARASPPARSTLNNAKAHMNTLPSTAARKAYLRSRAGNMANANWHALDRYKQHLNVMGPIAKKLAKMMKLSNNEYISKNGELYDAIARAKTGVTAQRYNQAATQAFNKDPKFLKKSSIPYIGPGRPNEAFMKKHKLKNSTVLRTGKTLSGGNTGDVRKKVYFNKYGFLYYLNLNGRKNHVFHAPNAYRIEGGSRNMRQLKRLIGMSHANYPRGAIPPASPRPVTPRRSSPELLENMMNQIYSGGRGSNVNAGRYTNAERNVLARRLTNSIQHFKRERDAKKAEAARSREMIRTGNWFTNAEKQWHRNKAAAANERVGYYDDAVRAYTRGLRAVKPLTGAVTPRARAMPNTPNRYTPAPANVENNAIYMPLNRPHLVVKTPGAGTIYLNPNTFTGYVKNSARVNIAPANVRNWLRTARRNFPNEPLFRHPLAPKNVTASHIRFSRA
jgi:hypothetical protein